MASWNPQTKKSQSLLTGSPTSPVVCALWEQLENPKPRTGQESGTSLINIALGKDKVCLEVESGGFGFIIIIIIIFIYLLIYLFIA
jgi:hypothetical protein